VTAKDERTLHKYNPNKLIQSNIFTFSQVKQFVPQSMHTGKWFNTFLKLNFIAITNKTWSKYNSALAKFQHYCKKFNVKLS
jgi:hypothetical protein